MFNVNYKITIGKEIFGAGKKDALIDLDVFCGFCDPVNAAYMTFVPDAEIRAMPEDKVKIELGYDDKLTVVFTGKVDSIKSGVHCIKVDVLGSFAIIAGARANFLYEKEYAGSIVKNLAGKFKVEKKSVEQGIKFPFYMISEQKSVWEHLSTLAKQCGFDFYADSNDKLNFKLYKAKKNHIFEYGANILNMEQSTNSSYADGVEVYGESPAGQGQGEQASSWLTKKEVKGAAGEKKGKIIRMALACVKNKNAADKIAKNLMSFYGIKKKGDLKVAGAPKLALGDSIEIKKMPQAMQNGKFKPVTIRHRLNKKKGFITDISWVKAAT